MPVISRLTFVLRPEERPRSDARSGRRAKEEDIDARVVDRELARDLHRFVIAADVHEPAGLVGADGAAPDVRDTEIHRGIDIAHERDGAVDLLLVGVRECLDSHANQVEVHVVSLREPHLPQQGNLAWRARLVAEEVAHHLEVFLDADAIGDLAQRCHGVLTAA